MTKMRRPKQSRSLVPSEITEEYWVSAFSPSFAAHDGLRSGKWLVFTPPDGHDEAWDKNPLCYRVR